MKKSGWWKGVLKYAVAVALLALVLAMNWSGLRDLFSREPNLAPLVGAFFLFALVVAVQYYRWYILVRALDLPFTLRNAFRLGLVGTFYNSFLPGAIGGDIVKAFFIAKGQPGRRAAAVATVVADRMLGLFGLILFAGGVGGAYWLSGDEKLTTGPAAPKLQFIILLCAALAAGAVVGYLLLGLVSAERMRRFGDRLHRVRRVGHTLAELWYTVWQYRQRPGAVAAGVGLSALSHVAMLFVFHLAVGIFPPREPRLLGTLPEHFVIAPIGYIVQALIPLPGGIGGGELTFGGLYAMIRGQEAVALGLTRQDAVAVGLAGRLAMRLPEWLVGLIGYIAFLRMREELPIEEAEAADEQDDPLDERRPPDEKGKDVVG